MQTSRMVNAHHSLMCHHCFSTMMGQIIYLSKSPNGEGLSGDTSAEIERNPQAPIRNHQIKICGERWKEMLQERMLPRRIKKMCQGELATSETNELHVRVILWEVWLVRLRAYHHWGKDSGFEERKASRQPLWKPAHINESDGWFCSSPYNLILQFGIAQCGACQTPTSAKMNLSEDTPNLHALKQTSATDASEPEGLSPMKKKHYGSSGVQPHEWQFFKWSQNCFSVIKPTLIGPNMISCKFGSI
jgi:hypothetical protein